MKRVDLIKEIEDAGFVFLRSGGKHDIYANENGKVVIPRHREINEKLAKSILKKIGK